MNRQLLTILIFNFIFVSTVIATDGGVVDSKKEPKSIDSTVVEQPVSKITDATYNSPEPIKKVYQQILSVDSNSLDLIYPTTATEQPAYNNISDTTNNSYESATIAAYVGVTTIFLLFAITAFVPLFKEEAYKETAVSSTINTTIDQEIRAKVIAIIEANIADPDFDMSALAEALGRKVQGLSQYLKKYVGNSFTALRIEVRMRKAKEMLAQGLGVGDTAIAVGYKDTASFSKAFKRYTGITPTIYKNDLKLQ